MTNLNECEKWIGKTRKDGRPWIRFEGQTLEAARYVHLTQIGEIPIGMCVSHLCKNKFCINPKHLFLTYKSPPVKERFFKFVDIPKNENLCWIWKGFKDKDGYGHFQVKELGNRAHRISYLIFIGEIPSKMCVCHTCDIPSCVNPKHLFLGTIADNNLDRDMKNRLPHQIPPIHYGKDNPKTKLTENQVLEIRDLLKQGISRYRLARIYKVSEPNIRSIDLGLTWKNIK